MAVFDPRHHTEERRPPVEEPRVSPASSLRMKGQRFNWSRIDPNLPAGLHHPKHDGDCGWDLEAMERYNLFPGDTRDIAINCRLELPPGYWASIEARSSIVRRGLQVDAGIIDNGYRGQIFAVTRNVGAAPVAVEPGERVAQLVFHRLNDLWCTEVPEIDISGTTRGDAGFGSTGA